MVDPAIHHAHRRGMYEAAARKNKQTGITMPAHSPFNVRDKVYQGNNDEQVDADFERFRLQVAKLKALAGRASEADAREITSRIAQLSRTFRIQHGIGIAKSPVEQALEVDKTFRTRPHLDYLSSRITSAVRDVENGIDRFLVVSMPPRSGKTHLTSYFTPLWMLRRHPEWNIISASYDNSLTTQWARSIRRLIEEKPGLGIALQRDGGAGGQWSTVEGGGLHATSVGGTMTGLGARVVIIDDPIKNFADAHSPAHRERLWNWWTSVVLTRLEPPSLVIVVATRWHEDDMIGRLLSADHAGDPEEWEDISIPAVAEDTDVLDREPGEPLYSPLVSEETQDEAKQRWDKIKTQVGSYTFASMYQQRPAPPQGSIFDASWWRYWTTDPSLATEDGRVIYIEPDKLPGAVWIDSWDATFGAKESAQGSYVVGQRWMRHRANCYLIAQKRGRWSFTQTVKQMMQWSNYDPAFPALSPYGDRVHTRLIEKKANGAAIIDTLRNDVSGLKPINPTESKDARARAVTAGIESGNVFLPYHGEPGNEWVKDLLVELRNFPHGDNDDQVDSLTQALNHLRTSTGGNVARPNANINPNRVDALKSQPSRLGNLSQRIK